MVRDQIRVRLSTYFLVSAANTLPHEIANTEIWPKKNGEITGSAISNRAIAACKLAIELDTSVIAITGDVTDTGAEEEWKQFAKVLAKAFQSQSDPPVLVLPGNHDLTFNEPNAPDPNLHAFRARAARMRKAINQVPICMRLPGDSCEFPRVITLEVDHAFTKHISFLLLDTNRYPSHNALSGAIGLLGAEQLRHAADYLNKIDGPLMVLMHHHLGLLNVAKWDIQELSMVAIDGGQLLRNLQDYQARGTTNRVLVLHGHKHQWIEAIDAEGKIPIFGLPSTTLGRERKIRKRVVLDGTVRVAAIQLSPTGEWGVSIHRVKVGGR